MKVILLICALLMLECCSSKDNEVEKKTTIKLKPPKTIQEALKQNQLLALGISIEDAAKIVLLYKSQKLLWHEGSKFTKIGQELNYYMTNQTLFGIPDERWQHLNAHVKTAFQKDILLTYKLSTIQSDLKYGFIDDEKKIYQPISISSPEEFEKILAFGNDTCSVAQSLIYLGPRRYEYQVLARALYKYVSNTQLTKDFFPVKTQKQDSLNWKETASKSLDIQGIEQDTLLSNRIAKFQKSRNLNQTGLLGEQTARELSMSNYEKYLYAALSLEKWRWKTENLNRFIRVNIPEFTLRFYDDDTLRSVNRVVVGTSETPTPQLKSEIHTVIVYPYWSVPGKIAKQEILPAVKRNINYLAKHHYRLLRNDREVDPSTVNWSRLSNIPYTVRQDYGSWNSLGVVKFDFHNKYGVYIHDTPSKRLFGNQNRSYSHGCVRCEKPLDLAKKILEIDKNLIIADSIDSMIFRGFQQFVKLKRTIPIYIDYITVTTNESWNIVFNYDLYRRDEEWLKVILRKNSKEKAS